MALEYFISRKGELSVLTLQGEVDETSDEILTKCMDELAAQKPKYVVVTLQATVTKEAQRIFTVLQKQMRDLGAKLRICVENQDTRESLSTLGIVREDEIRKDLKEALLEISNELKAK